jgi:hypothetical protein
MLDPQGTPGMGGPAPGAAGGTPAGGLLGHKAVNRLMGRPSRERRPGRKKATPGTPSPRTRTTRGRSASRRRRMGASPGAPSRTGLMTRCATSCRRCAPCAPGPSPPAAGSPAPACRGPCRPTPARAARYHAFSPEERAEIERGQQRWLPRFFQGKAAVAGDNGGGGRSDSRAIVRERRPDAREGQAGPPGVTVGPGAPAKPGNSGGGKGPEFQTDAPRGTRAVRSAMSLSPPQTVQKLPEALHADP